jgi:hypothetical protein
VAKLWSIIANVVLYGFLLWLLYRSAVVERDPWLAVVVGFVVIVAVVISVVPRLHATRVSPGEYPFDD